MLTVKLGEGVLGKLKQELEAQQAKQHLDWKREKREAEIRQAYKEHDQGRD
jgi:hypothetical protein